jgi:Ca2+/Na+ antiporter
VIGLLTAVVSDLATIFGCIVGLKDTVTAIVFVALGTSMPDTFASKLAAVNEQYADCSVGNVNGSNAVNVFLGLGLPFFDLHTIEKPTGLQYLYPRTLTLWYHESKLPYYIPSCLQ